MTTGETPERPERQRQLPDILGGAEGSFESARAVRGEVSFSLRSSPYPTPDDLDRYEQIHPGFTDRMLSLTERETDHRIELEKYEARELVSIAKRGQVFGFIVVMVLVGGGIAAILAGHSIAGLAGIGVGAAALVGAFVAPKWSENRRKREQGAIDQADQELGELPPSGQPNGD